MVPRHWSASLLAFFFAPAVFAAPAPNAYTVTEVNSMSGAPVTMTIWRDGPIAVVEHKEGSHSKSFYDLASGRTFSWNADQAAPSCGSGTFSGDWGDPFSQDLLAGLPKMHPREAGTEVVNGFRTRIVEADDPQGRGKFRLFIDQSFGELVKWVTVTADGKTSTMLELTSLTVGKPPPGSLTLAPECAKLAGQPAPPSDAERIAALTGSQPGAYVSALVGPGSEEQCMVKLSVVKPRTRELVKSGYRVGVDIDVDVEHPASYQVGASGFSGGQLHELTAQMRGGGVLTLVKPGKAFDIELIFGEAGASSALIYRHCSPPRTARLLYVVKNPDKLSDGGEWLWEK